MSRQLISRILTACAAALMLAACHAPALEEEIQLPEKQEPVVVPEWTTIPFSLKVNTEATKVSYETGSYQFKEGDKLRVTGVGRTIHGDLTQQDGGIWSGELSYLTSEGELDGNTPLEITLIHADNDDTDTYASALVGSGNVTNATSASLLQYAVEHHSLFTASTTLSAGTGTSTESITLSQQAAFLEVTFTFDFDGSHEVEPGQAWVDLEVDGKELSTQTQFYATDSRNEDFQVHFMAVIPGGKKTDEFILMVGDREIEFQKNSDTNTYPTLDCNKKYTVNRTVVYGPQLGDPFWSDGTYGRLNHSDPNASIVGIIVYVNHHYEDTEKARIENAITEADAGFGHGLVMALKNVTLETDGVEQNRFAWSGSVGKQKCTAGFIETPSQTMDSPYFSGLENTNKIVEKLGNGNDSAASLAKNYGVKPGTSSGWFLPSIGQWMYTISIDGFGNAEHADEWINGAGRNWLQNGNVTGDLVYVKKCDDPGLNVLVKALNDRLTKLHSDFSTYNFEYEGFGDPSGEGNISDNYWTSTEKSADQAIRMNLGTVEKWSGVYYSTIKAKGENKTTIKVYTDKNGVEYKMKVRPFLAF